MKVLIVDDSVEKTSAILALLTQQCNIERDDIVTTQTAVDAKRELRNVDFDLLILDILIPVRIEEEPRVNVSVDLLNEIYAEQRLRKPKYIVGLTAYEESKAEVEQHFRERLWTVLYYDPTSVDWLTSIRNSVIYLDERLNQPSKINYDVDLCVITALLDPEETAVTKLPWNWQPPEPLDSSLFFRRGRIESGTGNHSVVLAHAPRMGMVSTALTSAKLIEKFRPRFLVMVGICAAYEGKANIGDVLVADPSWDYQSGKRVREHDTASFEIDPHQLPIPGFVRTRFEQLKNDHHLWSEIKNEWQGTQPETELKLHIGPVASGSAVLDDGQVMLEIKAQHRKLLGVEMEIYGMFAAAEAAGSPRPTPIALKSVCDFGNGTKDDALQRYAAYTSAQALKVFVERHLSEILEEAGHS